jgi:hypothetical protein
MDDDKYAAVALAGRTEADTNQSAGETRAMEEASVSLRERA